MERMLEKGLDPNFHDEKTGGMLLKLLKLEKKLE